MSKKERFICDGCQKPARSKNKKKKWCDTCVQRMAGSKIIS